MELCGEGKQSHRKLDPENKIKINVSPIGRFWTLRRALQVVVLVRKIETLAESWHPRARSRDSAKD